MSNHNAYWGKWFGSVHADGTNQFTPRQLGSGKNVSGPHQEQVDPRSARGLRAAADRALFAARGRPIHYVNHRGHTIRVEYEKGVT